MDFFTRKIFYALLFLLSFSGKDVFASHIVGGDITVKYLSPNTFEVSMTYFRDCSGIAYPATVTVGVYRKDDNTLQQSFVMSPFSTRNLTLGDGCYTPALCIQERIYRTNITLPDHAPGYYLAYGECCRNAAINNIVGPSSEGYVFYTEVADPAMQNSTPVFTSFPDGYMCRNYVNTDVFTASDLDGDDIVYSLTTPLASSVVGPPGPLPYGNVTWQAGYYTTNPIGDPGMIINPSTGVINTLPPNLGKFVLSVKLEEYRNGVKLGEINRDFQFEVLNCQLLNLSINPGNPICLGTNATIVPSGAGAGFSYSWAPTGQTTSSIVVSPTTTGSYNYTCTATNGACVKVATTLLVSNPNPTATVVVTGDVCAGQNNTLIAYGGITYSWSNGSPLSFIAGSPGTYTCTVTNAYNCSQNVAGTISSPVASSYTWTGTGATGANNWFDSNNWGNSYGCIPNCLTDVFIPNVSNDPDIGTALGPASCKDITIFTGTLLTFSDVNSELDICGDFIDHGLIQTTGGQKGVLKFIGSSPQNFLRSNTAAGNPFYRIILANSAFPVPKLTINDGVGYKDINISASGNFTFQSGLLVTEGLRKLVFLNSSSTAISGYGPNRYVVGRIKRDNLALSTSYDFPVGNLPTSTGAYPYQLLNINFSDLNGLNDITISFENPLLTNANGVGLPVSEIGPTAGQYTDLLDNGGNDVGIGDPAGAGGVWTIIPGNYAPVPTYSMTLKGNNYDNEGSYVHSILKRNTFCPGTWSVSGNYLSSLVSGDTVTASRTSMTGFSQVVIAKTLVPLPVQLILFDASCEKEKTVLSWVTASEQNNDYFTIERSCDENYFQFQVIGTVTGSGNSNTLKTYSFTDETETSGDCYYRLSQTDLNGTTTEFAPVKINCEENAAFNFVGVVPNPAKDLFNVLFTSVNPDPVTIVLSDLLGKEILRKTILPETGLNHEEIIISELPSGIYFIAIDNGKKSFVKKLMKQE